MSRQKVVKLVPRKQGLGPYPLCDSNGSAPALSHVPLTEGRGRHSRNVQGSPLECSLRRWWTQAVRCLSSSSACRMTTTTTTWMLSPAATKGPGRGLRVAPFPQLAGSVPKGAEERGQRRGAAVEVWVFSLVDEELRYDEVMGRADVVGMDVEEVLNPKKGCRCRERGTGSRLPPGCKDRARRRGPTAKTGSDGHRPICCAGVSSLAKPSRGRSRLGFEG
jgi:hypothetical protein